MNSYEFSKLNFIYCAVSCAQIRLISLINVNSQKLIFWNFCPFYILQVRFHCNLIKFPWIEIFVPLLVLIDLQDNTPKIKSYKLTFARHWLQYTTRPSIGWRSSPTLRQSPSPPRLKHCPPQQVSIPNAHHTHSPGCLSLFSAAKQTKLNPPRQTPPPVPPHEQQYYYRGRMWRHRELWLRIYCCLLPSQRNQSTTTR